MLASFFDAAWLFGVIVSIGLLFYGAWIVWQFQSEASVANQKTVARLALNDWQPRNEVLSDIKVAAVRRIEQRDRSQPALTVAAAPRASPYLERSRRVLVVEDNLDAVHSMARLITMMGHECKFAINGFAALQISREFRPEIILLDIGLPDLKGSDIAKQLKWEPGLEATRIIALTALPEEDQQRIIEAGCDEFYRKPLDPMLLEQLLTRRLPLDQQAAA